jgi:drug/metabolite transporter (DMT)-like permease
LFAALVPSSAVLLAIPLTAQWPDPLQWAGVVLASVGLIVSLDLWAGRARPLPHRAPGARSGD